MKSKWLASGISENIPRVELEALLYSAASHQQHRWREGHQLYATTLDVPNFSSSLKRDIFMKYKVIVQVKDKVCG